MTTSVKSEVKQKSKNHSNIPMIVHRYHPCSLLCADRPTSGLSLSSRVSSSSPSFKSTSSVQSFRASHLVAVPSRVFGSKMVFTILLFISCILSVSCVKINSISPPQSFRIGDVESVILDCDFDFQGEDKPILKWFHESNSTHPIYQWIPNRESRIYSPMIQPYVDETFSVNDKSTRFRAIRLIKPPRHLSGEYRCQVSSIENEQSKSTQLVLYEPEKKFDFAVVDIDDPKSVNFTCTAIGIFPEPELQLYKIYSVHEKIETTQIDAEKTTVLSFRSVADGLYSVTLVAQVKITPAEDTASLPDIDSSEPINDVSGEGLQSESSMIRQRLLLKRSKMNKSRTTERAVHYECRLNIPKTSYSKTRRLAIQDGWKRIVKENNSSNGHRPSFVTLIVFTGGNPEHKLSPKHEQVLYGCNHTLECPSVDSPIYSVKWSKFVNGSYHEFYSYVNDSESCTIKKRLLSGIQVAEDNEKMFELPLIGVDILTEGLFVCEVTIEQTFEIVRTSFNLSTLVIPNNPPVVERLDKNGLARIGDILQFRCTTDWSRPVSSALWTINGWPIRNDYIVSTDLQPHSVRNNVLWREQSWIAFQLRHEHFNHDSFDELTLTCGTVFPTPATRNVSVSNNSSSTVSLMHRFSPIISGLPEEIRIYDTLNLNCSIPALQSSNEHTNRTTLEWIVNGRPINKRFIINYFNFTLLGLRLPLSSLELDYDEIDIQCVTKQYRLIVPQITRPKTIPFKTFQQNGNFSAFNDITIINKSKTAIINESTLIQNSRNATEIDEKKDWITSLQVSLIPFGIIAAFFVLR